ncbi:MAG: hypothetical protein ACRDHM_03295 [Actinomycetota bacterium]
MRADGPTPPRTALDIDIGGTKIAAGIVDERGRLLVRARQRTHNPSVGGSSPPSPTEAQVTAQFRLRNPAVLPAVLPNWKAQNSTGPHRTT